MGEGLAAPNTAASVVTAPTYVPYNTLQYAPAFARAESRTSKRPQETGWLRLDPIALRMAKSGHVYLH